MEEKMLEEFASDLAARQSQKMKKKLIMILCAVFGALILLLATIAIISMLDKKEIPGYEYGEEAFYPTYEGNIMEYKAYLDLDRSVSYCADPAGYGETSTITEENRKDYSEGVLFLYDYVQTIIAGNTAAYNACFNGNYYKSNQRKEAFSPQMIYGTKITYVTEETDGADKLRVYRLEYMIFQNDGTFRRDITSDASRPQNVLLRITPDGRISIENITTIYYQ
jgi:hypothetical protein